MSILKYKDPKTGKFKRINPYKADMSFVGKDGIVVNKAANSEMVEISGSGCVQDPAPGKNNSGGKLIISKGFRSDKWATTFVRNSVLLVENALDESLAGYGGNGQLYVKTTTDEDYSVPNKKYVEDNYVKKVKFTNLEQALNGYILDTTKEAYVDLDSAVLKNSVAVGDNVYPIADKTRALVTRIEGKTTKMVQLLDKSTYYKTQTKLGITATNNGDGSWTINGTATASSYINFSSALSSLVGGHKVLICGNKENSNFHMGLLNQAISDIGTGAIGIVDQSAEKSWGISWRSGAVINNVTITPQLFDLTAMNREDITTAEQFKAEFPEVYPYENGNIYPAKISGVKFTGKNLLDFSTVSSFFSGTIIGMAVRVEGDEVHITGTPTESSALNIIKTSNLSLIRHNYVITGFDIRGTSAPSSVSLYGLRAVDTSGQIALNLALSGMEVGKAYDFYFKVMVSVKTPTAYEPYTEPVSVTLPETYDLHGIGDYKDYLEITKNENNELYTLKKVQNIGSVDLGTLEWEYANNQFYTIKLQGIKAYLSSEVADIYCVKYTTSLKNKISNGCISSHESDQKYITIMDEDYTDAAAFKESLSGVMLYYALATPVETVIATNLTYEQVTAIRHNGGLIEVEGNANKAYAKPTVTNTIVYRLTATNTAEG